MNELALRFCEIQNYWILLRPRQIILQLLKGQRVLDVCCGGGDLSSLLVSVGCHVVGVDNSSRMVLYARQKCIDAEFMIMDACAMPFTNEFDAAVISLALHSLSKPNREKVWDSMVRAVRPGGHLIALDFTLPKHINLFSRIISKMIEQDESKFRKSHPEHYENYQGFIQSGGLRDWILSQKEIIDLQHYYWGGTIELVVCRNINSEGYEK
jgi:ubiquinone/menaquinone biosynthesis C-methylase UbiE